MVRKTMAALKKRGVKRCAAGGIVRAREKTGRGNLSWRNRDRGTRRREGQEQCIGWGESKDAGGTKVKGGGELHRSLGEAEMREGGKKLEEKKKEVLSSKKKETLLANRGPGKNEGKKRGKTGITRRKKGDLAIHPRIF